MNLCSDGHEDICYESRDCPLCNKIKELDAAEELVRQLDTKLEDA